MHRRWQYLVFRARVCTRVRQGTHTRVHVHTLVGAACYTEVLYRLTVGNRREAEESLSGAAAWLWLSYIINLSLSASLPLPRVPVLSRSRLSLPLPFSLLPSVSRSPTAHPGGCLPLLPVVSPLTHLTPSELCLPLLAPLDLPYTRPSSQSGVAGSFRASKRIKSYGRRETRPPLALLVPRRYLPVSRWYLWLRCVALRCVPRITAVPSVSCLFRVARN